MSTVTITWSSTMSHKLHMHTALQKYTSAHCMSDTTFSKLFLHTDRHCMVQVFKLFDVCAQNRFHAPWQGQWITASQAYRLLRHMCGSDTDSVTCVTLSILQFVFDWWNIRAIFGIDHPFNVLCGYPCMYPMRVPPALGPRQRLTANDFAMDTSSASFS